MITKNQKGNPELVIKTGYKPWLVSGLLLFSDLAAIFISFFISFYLRKILIPIIGGVLNFDQVAPCSC